MANRKALSLVELVVFLGIFVILIGSVIPLMAMGLDHYFQQKNMSMVENNAVLLMNDITKNIRSGERVLKPQQGQTGSVLALQTGWGLPSPLVIGISNGIVKAFSESNESPLMTTEVNVENLVFRNASTAESQNVDASFSLSVTAGTPPRTYRKNYAFSVTLFDIANTQGNPCACDDPHCPTENTYVWDTCYVTYEESEPIYTCTTSTGAILCNNILD